MTERSISSRWGIDWWWRWWKKKVGVNGSNLNKGASGCRDLELFMELLPTFFKIVKLLKWTLMRQFSFFKDCPGWGANLGSFWFSFIFSHQQCLRPLGYCAPVRDNLVKLKESSFELTFLHHFSLLSHFLARPMKRSMLTDTHCSVSWQVSWLQGLDANVTLDF